MTTEDFSPEYRDAIAAVRPHPVVDIPGLPDGEWVVPALWAIQDGTRPVPQLTPSDGYYGTWDD